MKGFNPQLSPEEMLELGVFGGYYFKGDVSEYPTKWFEKAKISESGFDEKLSRLERVFATLKRRKVGADYILFGDVPSRVVVKERLRKSKKTKTVTLNVSGA